MNHNFRLVYVLLLLGVLSATVLAQETPDLPPEESKVWDEVLELYEEAKRRGEKVPKDVYEWVKEDLDRMGDWEYRVLEWDSSRAETLEKELNELGTERWELVWVQAVQDRTRFVLKRPVQTYLNRMNLFQLIRLVP